MYIEPFWCGVIAAFLAEAVVCAVLIARATKTNWNVGEDETNEEQKKEIRQMIVTDFNEMTLEELEVINASFGVTYQIEDGKITGTNKED